ncbi:hypothetical protein GUITHDRAFT_147691 [Guillardia theta CCMP2712]|uniref:ceramide glucosyltransferase n=1 Tax=Guillardia theta (strain CCMP2712) TaxID=905079 RepID=L1ICX3_GUITC|nr:hypothetical protein GUITHDRAFT_147691 [Guillardia theta CCMP2712]EKX33759.1 hypothetical protein GUITHDRAFT_147691 [Guillardia theta CCMP2712]|eukprot:XP_005820739.1 hypothetical protein GUITHDRAFT_147691 [Guillardia theta CCMP2712]
MLFELIDDLACHESAQLVWLASSCLAVVYVVGWYLMCRRMNSWTLEEPSHAKTRKGHKVSVILPVKGVHEQTLDNWRTQIKLDHGGETEYFFCMESTQDPVSKRAYKAAMEFKEEQKDLKNVNVVVCGLSFYCTQKIHNLLEGVSQISKESNYVLFLDDDAQMSSRILLSLMDVLDRDDKVLIAYRMLSVIALGQKYPTVLWGGCLLLRTRDLFDDKVGILQAWEDCGYSDDMIMAGRASKVNKKIFIPPVAVLPSMMKEDYSVRNHWNYIRRQMFVCDTYSDIFDRMNNLFLLIVICIIVLLVGCLTFQVLILASLVGAGKSWLLGHLSAYHLNRQSCGWIPLAPDVLYVIISASAVIAMLDNSIVWSGICYKKAKGKMGSGIQCR